MNFIPKHEMHDKAIERYQLLRVQLDDHISKVEFENWTKTLVPPKNDQSDKSEVVIPLD